MQRLTDFTKGLAGLIITLGLIVGLPIGLTATVGWPLPTQWPGSDTVVQHLTDGDIPDIFIIKLIASIVWIAWAQLAVATITEYTSILRGKVATRSPALPAARMLAAKLATWTTLLVSAAAPLRPALAAPLPTVASITATPAASSFHTAELQQAVGPKTVVTQAVAKGRYQSVRGDTWWDISERLLGDGIRWNEIRSLNVGTRMPDGATVTASTEAVKPGWPLRVPLGANLPATETQPATNTPAREVSATADEVVVVEGDHFWSIAKDTLADAWGRQPTDIEMTPYWVELVAANEDRLLPPGDPDLIYPDQTFTIPTPPPNPDIAVDLNGTEVLDPPEAISESESTEIPNATPDTTPAPADAAWPTLGSQDVVPSSPVLSADQPAAEAAADGESVLDDVLDVAKPVAAVAGGIALLGGTLLYTLRRLRRIQAARRRPGTTIDPPEPEAAEFEQRIRAISTDGEDARYIAAANDYLSHALEKSSTPIPSLIAARAGQFGLELLLDDPCEPVAGFVATGAEQTAWRLDADLEVDMMENAVKGDAHPFAPALCVVGSTDAGELLVDLEQLGAVAIQGDTDQVADFQRGLLASVCVAPWATHCEIIAIGIEGLTGDHLSRATIPDDPNSWAAQTADQMSGIAATLDRSPYQERVDHGTVYHPTIVFIGPDASLAGIAEHLAQVAELAYSPLALVSAHPLAGEYRIQLEPDNATLEPVGIAFLPVSLEAAELAAVDHLVANASDRTTSPPADEWADDIAKADTDDQVTDNGAAANGAEPSSTEAAREAEPPEPAVDTNGSEPELESATAEPSDATVKAIKKILRPKPVEVRILGRRPVVDGLDGEVTPKIEAIIAYLGFHREVVGRRLRDDFWPGSPGRQGCDNAIGRARTLLGMDHSGEPRLITLRATNSYLIGDDVGVDWHRAQALIDAAKGQAPVEEAAYLDAACELIDGHVAVDAHPEHYAWLLGEPSIYSLIETTLVDAAHRRGELALAVGDVERANWAAERGLDIVEGQEAMYRMKMEAAAKAGDAEGIKAAYRQAQRAAESYGYDDEVQPETQALYEKLAGSSGEVRSPDSASR